jgi:hypothetical protein
MLFAAEQDDLDALLAARDPRRQLFLAEQFTIRHPQSWNLAAAHEIAAKAAMALHDKHRVLGHSRISLNLFPENALLLTALAEWQAKQGMSAEAARNAEAARFWTSRFQPPPAHSKIVKRTQAAYAGSASCEKCHKPQYDAWRKTGMANMLRAYSPANIFPEAAQADARDLAARMVADPDRYYMEIRRDNGEWDRYRIDYTIGSKWQQAYATKAPGGQIHVFPVQFSRVQQRWVNYWSMIDPPDSPRARPGDFHKFDAATNYQQNCASCHTSQLWTAKGFETASFKEAGVNCEMCHGPLARHAEGKASAPGFARMPAADYVAVCAQCHMQSAIRQLGPHGEMNYTGDTDYFRRYQSRPYAEFLRTAFYKDGRFRETTFIVESFLRSRCFREGQAHCGHCHDPHPPDADRNPASLKFRGNPDERCLQCHQSMRGAIAKHTRHPETSEASRCESCHMPRIMNSLLFQARTHTIDDIPGSEMARKFGPAESPNACLGCHKEKDPRWLESQLASW